MAWGQIAAAGIGVAGSLLGGLMGRNSEKRAYRQAIEHRNWQAEREDTYVQRMVDQYRAVGMNPVTMMGRGAGTGFASIHMPTLGRSSMANAVGNIGIGLADAFQAAFDYDPVNEEHAQLQLEVQRAQIRNMNADTARMLRATNPATATGTTSHQPVLGGTATPEIGRSTVTNPWGTDTDWTVQPHWQDAEMFETRYGDIAQEVFGLGNLAADLWGIGSRWARTAAENITLPSLGARRTTYTRNPRRRPRMAQ